MESLKEFPPTAYSSQELIYLRGKDKKCEAKIKFTLNE